MSNRLHGSNRQPGRREAAGGARGALLRNLALLVIVCAGAAWALSYRAEVSESLDAMLPSLPAPQVADDSAAQDSDGDETAADREVVIRRSPNGHFLLEAAVNGVAIRFLVDTGASDVVLSAADAKRLRLNPSKLRFTQQYQTANGVVSAAPITLREVRIGQLEVYDVAASVNQGPMGISLLGMSFLERLNGYAVRGERLILQW